MPVWCVTGKLGSGKNLMAVHRIQKYLNQNRRIATNLDLNLENLITPYAKNSCVYRLPDVPDLASFKAIGLGYDGKMVGDEKNGLVVLDECARWLNSRSWNDKSRKELIDYFVHLRKLRWDMVLIIQDIEALDKQFRDLYCEHIVYCSRSDRYAIPFIGPILKLFWGEKVPLPRIHIGNVYYVVGHKENHVENWVLRGNSLYEAYDTEQSFNESTSPQLYQYLPPYLTTGRFIKRYDEFKKVIKSLKISHFFLLGALIGGAFIKAITPDGNEPDRGIFTCNADWELLFGDCNLTKADVQKMVKSYKNGGIEVKPVSDLSDEGQAEDGNILDFVYISGSVWSTNGYDYVFYDGNGNTFHPPAHGLKVKWITECNARLFGVGVNREIYCTPTNVKEEFNIASVN